MPALVAQANHGLERLCLAPLTQRDSVVSTPEELAPVIPPELRGALADLLLELAGDEPLRRRMALTYLGLWKLRAPEAPREAAPQLVERLARSIIGPLPSHQGVSAPKERAVVQ